MRKIDVGIRVLYVEEFFFNLIIDFADDLRVKCVTSRLERVGEKYLLEGATGEIWDELVVTVGVIARHV